MPKKRPNKNANVDLNGYATEKFVKDEIENIKKQPFTDMSDSLGWTTKTLKQGDKTGWYVFNNVSGLEVDTSYLYVCKWKGGHLDNLDRCNELRNYVWYPSTTKINETSTESNVRTIAWIFKTENELSSGTKLACVMKNDITITTEVEIEVELYKILDESYVSSQFCKDVCSTYHGTNKIRDFDFLSDKLNWYETKRSKSKWYNKKTLVIGDSITADGRWQLELEKQLGLVVSTHAKGGVGILEVVDGDKGILGDYDNTTNAEGTLFPLNTEDVGDKDLIIILVGYNERMTEFGDKGDCYNPNTNEGRTLIGKTQYLIDRIYEELTKSNNLTCKILTVIPHCVGGYGYVFANGYEEYPLGSGRTFEMLCETIKETYQKNNLPICDLYHDSGINKYNWCVNTHFKESINEDYAQYELDSQGNVVGMSPLLYQQGKSYYQNRNGQVVLETYNSTIPYPYMNDQLHCNGAGYKLLGECIIGSLIKYFGY